jgi:hypothetical protein
LMVYISVSVVMAAYGSALTAGYLEKPVGASLLAMEVNDDAGSLTPRSALRFFASKLAPTEPAAIGHPWPGAANPASMPGCPLRRTSSRPHEGARRSKAKAKAKAKARRPTGRPVRGVRSSVMYLVDWQAAFASRLAPTGRRGYTRILRPTLLKLWERACSRKRSVSQQMMLNDQPHSRASRIVAPPLPQKSKGRSANTNALHHSTGRALARLQLLILILIRPPPRQAEWRRSSGGGRVAPFGAAEHIERRSSEADRRRCPRMNAGAKEPRA